MAGVIATLYLCVSGLLLTAEPAPHACVPTAACLVLSYFGEKAHYAEVSAECAISPDGSTPISDLLKVCRQHGLKASAFKSVSLSQVKCWLDEGYAVVGIPSAPGKNHAVAMFGSKVFTSDLISPVHEANQGRLDEFLKSGMVCVVIGRREPALIRWWMSAGVAVVLVLGVGNLILNRQRMDRREPLPAEKLFKPVS